MPKFNRKKNKTGETLREHELLLVEEEFYRRTEA